MNEIFTRVSIRKYENRPVEPEKIEKILRAAMQAPSTGNQQPWEFYVVTDRATIEKLSKVHQYAGCAAGAPVVIVPCYRTKDLWVPEWAQIDLSIATENLWLETTAQGLGGVWMGIAPQEDRMQAVEEILGMPGDLRAFAIFPLGYPAESRPQEDRWDPSRIHYVR
jgi:nitroreductase